MASTQADVDALTAQVGTVASDLASAKDTIQSELDSLKAANPGVDLSGLQAAIAPLDDAAKSLGGLTPTSAPAGTAPTAPVDPALAPAAPVAPAMPMPAPAVPAADPSAPVAPPAPPTG